MKDLRRTLTLLLAMRALARRRSMSGRRRPTGPARAARAAALAALLLGSGGCAVLMAFPADSPDGKLLMPPSKPIERVANGWSRERVHAKLGRPAHAEWCEGDRSVEVFEYRERHRAETWADWLFGYTRALVHLGADLFTFFAWEIPGTAFEMYVMGDRHLFLVRYGADGAVEAVERLGRAVDRPGDAGHCPGRAPASAAPGEDLPGTTAGRPRASAADSGAGVTA